MASIARVGIGVYCCVYWGILVYIVSVGDERVRDCGEIEGTMVCMTRVRSSIAIIINVDHLYTIYHVSKSKSLS
jgi:hypothetical protein